MLLLTVIVGCGRQGPTPASEPVRKSADAKIEETLRASPKSATTPAMNSWESMSVDEQRKSLLNLKPGTTRREVEQNIELYRSSNPSAHSSFEPNLNMPRTGFVTILYPLDNLYAEVVYETNGNDGAPLKDDAFVMHSISLVSAAGK